MYKVKKRGDETNKIYAAKIFEDGKNFGMQNEVQPLSLLNCDLTTRCEEVFESQEATGVIILDFIQGTSL